MMKLMLNKKLVERVHDALKRFGEQEQSKS